MFCTNCGAQLNENSRFCPQCGTAVKNMATAEAGIGTQGSEATQDSTSVQSSSASKPAKLTSTVRATVRPTVRPMVTKVMPRFNQENNEAAEDTETVVNESETVPQSIHVTQSAGTTVNQGAHTLANEGNTKVDQVSTPVQQSSNMPVGTTPATTASTTPATTMNTSDTMHTTAANNPYTAGLYPPNWIGSLSLIDNFIMCIRDKYADFKGRATRGEFWRFVLAQIVVSLLIGVIFGAISETAYTIVSTLVGLGLFIPSLAVQVRRLHDIGRTGWWYLLIFIPFGAIVILIFDIQQSQPYTNKYGPLPDYSNYRK